VDAGCLLELDVRGELVASLDGSHCDDLVGWWVGGLVEVRCSWCVVGRG
jgi:hypothetical protein